MAKWKIYGIPIKSFFSWKNWMSMLRGKIIGSDLKQSYMEQYMFRHTNPECAPCIEKGVCIHCGCNTHQKMLDPHAECAGKDEDGNPYWSAMVTDRSWKEYKDFVGLKFSRLFLKLKRVNNGEDDNSK